MDKTLKRTELELQLSGKAESISRRLDALQQEVTNISLKKAVSKKPLVAVGVAVLGGLTAGMLFGRGKAPGRKNLLHQSLIEGYIDAVDEEVRNLTDRGKDISSSVRAALQDRVPVLVYSPEEGTSQGYLGLITNLVVQTAVGFAVNAGLSYAASRLNVDAMMQELAAEAGGGADGAAASGQTSPSPAEQ